MPAINGVGAVIDSVSTGRSWSVDYSSPQVPLVASSTKNGEYILAGNKDWNATVNYFLTPATLLPPFVPGADVTFKGSIDESVGVSGPAKVERITIRWDIEGARPIECTMSLQGNGELLRGAAVATDTTDPDAYTSIGCKLEMDVPGGTPTGIDDIRTMELVMESTLVSYVSSSTGAQTKRLAGVFKATFSYTLYPGALSDLPEAGDVFEALLYVNGTDYYTLQWVVVNGVTGIEVNRETAAVVGATVNCNFTGWTKIATVLTEGKITTPDDEDYIWGTEPE